MSSATVKHQIKKYTAKLISLIPFNLARVGLYKWLLKYDIDWSAKIGFSTIIAAEKVSIGKQVKIGRYNLLVGYFTLKIEEGAKIGNRNEFICGDWVLDKKFENKGFARQCILGKNSLINNCHFIDLVGKFELQENSWIAGRQSQFWTHGSVATEKAISIGKNCYLGSAVRFIAGSQIGDNIIVGIGSVITRKFEINNALIAGVPAKVVKENYDFKTKTNLETV